MDISIIIPTYNERDTVVILIDQIIDMLAQRSVTFEIIVVDDASPDETGAFVQKTFRADHRITCIIRKGKPDLGKSILLGIQKSQGEVVVGMDADGNHDPASIPHLLQKLKTYDVVVASRFISGGGMQHRLRYLTSFTFNVVLRVLYGFPLRDNTSGFYAIRRSVLDHLNPSSIYHGYGEYHLRLVFKATKQQMKIAEIPVYYPYRIAGQSKSKFITMMRVYLRTAHQLLNDHS